VDRDAEFAEYAGARWSALVRSAVLLGCNAHDAEDLVQSTLSRCYVSWAKVRAADNRDAYVYRMLVNVFKDARRRRWGAERPVADVPETADGNDPAYRVESVDSVERALGHLSHANRSVVVLRFYARLSERETAEALNIAVGTVKSRLSRALSELAKSEHLYDQRDGNPR
jgi:RNA polymerase sigma-70 factor (sigma-E family)